MDEKSPPVGSYDFLAGGGQMGALIRSKDWVNTLLGPVEGWPRSLKTVVFLMLNSRYPMFVWWGRELTNFYNDAYIPVLGARHPEALGQPAASVWAEIWNVIGPQAAAVMREGRATWNESILLVMERYGYTEETYFTFSYSPALDDDGNVGGVFCACTEDTKRIIGERRLRTVRVLAEQATHAKSVEEACGIAAATMRDNPYDLPFALIYLLDAAVAQARLAGGTLSESPASPAVIELNGAPDSAWPLARVLACGESQVVSDLEAKFGPGVKLPGGVWPEPARQAVVLPLARPGQTAPYGFLIAGINPRLLLDDDYRGFLELTAGHIANAAANARAHEEERKRVEALAQIDLAKTAFFSNVSHEFRTPLTLILGPTEELLSGAQGETNDIQRAHLITLRHNAVRLQKLVNTLLEYARVEAGRIEATYEPVDIGLLTRELASTFCSAVHRAGLLYLVNCPSVDEPVYLDRDMWEKIVLNLLSNALKFTFKGAIEVSIESSGDRVAFVVRDTGVGIPDEELPRLFDRFHRVHATEARTQEGSGIGLALVQELVKLHGGSLQVESAIGSGTTFTIFIPKGSAHLPKERLSAPRTLSSTSLGAAPFVEEALRWLPDSDQVETLSLPVSASSFVGAPRSIAATAERILVADDNLEMRNYLKRLLEMHWNVTSEEDGAKALETARAQRPDLVLSDVMMPGLDGFELLRKLRADNRTNSIPVILLSARAGEESYIEGMNAGADDYIVKPFGARELVARVKALLEITRVRRESEQRVTNILESITDGFQVIDQDWRLTYLNSEAKRILAEHGKDPEWAIGKHFWDQVFPEGVESEIATELRRAMSERVSVTVETYYPPWNRWFFNRVYPLPEGGLANYFQDITDRKEAEIAKGKLVAIIESADDAIISKDLNGIITSWNLGAERIFGYSAQEAIGQPVSMLIPPERLGEEPNILELIRRGERIEHYETVRRRKDGMLLDISLSVSPISDAHGQIVGASKIARDISARKEAERNLRKSEERFRTMADNSPIMIWMTDATGSLTFVNRAYIEFFGVGIENLPAFDWPQRVHLEDRDRHVEAFTAALREAHPFHNRARVLRWDGRWRWLESRGAPLFDHAGKMTGYIGSSPDITDIYESQQRLKELDQRKDEFLANMSHEIRSPLTGIMGFADVLLGRLKDPEDIECLNTIKESGDYLIEIVNDILDLSKIEAGKLVLNIEAVSVHAILAEVQGLMDVRARQRKLPLTLRYESALPENVQTDRTRLRQILINLVSNAIKFTENGRVEIVARFIDSLLQIEVIDTGIGIAPEHQDILFQPFAQADTTSTRQYGGTGLGLTITRRLVEMLGGSISFESELGQGSTFRVKIPAGTARIASKATHLAPRVSAPFAELPLRNRHVLVVDDREEICYLVSRYIKDAGGRPDTVVDGETAIEAIETAAATDPFDAMILDIHMPGMDGCDVARTLRAKGFQTPIIALTAGAMVGDREKCLQAGCDDYLTKPIDRRKLVQLVDQHAKKAGRDYKGNGGKLRVLLVDDSHNACKFLTAFLEKRGHEVCSAYDGGSALSLATEFRPEVILLDIRLPDMNGYELMERLKALDSSNGAKFIALSGYRDGDAPGSMEFDHFLEKPLDTAHLDGLLRSIVD
jgi:PAS domain S-box-containing protein